MANEIEEMLLEEFAAIAPAPGAGWDPRTGQVLPAAAQASPKAQPAAQSGSGTTGQGGGALQVVQSIFKTGFGLTPLVSGLMSLFGGGGSTQPAPLVKYAMPQAIDFEAAESGAGVVEAGYDQQGMARAYDDGGRGSSTAGGTGGTQITVNVQAMDARSFLERSGEIAQAVREAMLNSSAINDVVSEL
jgi:hypothetical protein